MYLEKKETIGKLRTGAASLDRFSVHDLKSLKCKKKRLGMHAWETECCLLIIYVN